MLLIIKEFLSLEKCYKRSVKALPWLIGLTVLGVSIGIVWGLVIAPPDYQQGEAYRIIYIHVPAAWMSLLIYVTMAVSGAIALVWRTKVSELICVESAPIGASFAALALVTGMLWGKPMWGTYWVWDARLTSELILLFLYFGVIALHASIPDPHKAARAAALLSIVGVVNVPIIHYSVEWWSTLHQGPTVTRFDAPAAHPSMLFPLLFMSVVFILHYLTAFLARLCGAILIREKDRLWLRKMQ